MSVLVRSNAIDVHLARGCCLCMDVAGSKNVIGGWSRTIKHHGVRLVESSPPFTYVEFSALAHSKRNEGSTGRMGRLRLNGSSQNGDFKTPCDGLAYTGHDAAESAAVAPSFAFEEDPVRLQHEYISWWLIIKHARLTMNAM